MYLSAQYGMRGFPNAGFVSTNPAPRQALYRRTGLAALTPDQAAQQAMPLNTVSKTAGFTQTVYDDILQAAQSGNFISFNPTGCKGISPSGAKIAAAGATTAGSMILKFSGGNPIALGIGAAALIGGVIFGAIFGHHAAAVAKEQSVICAAVPAASDSLNAIYGAVQDGTMTPQQAQQALASLLAAFRQQVTSILKMDSSHCNAACVWVKQLTAIVAQQTSILQDKIDAAAKSPSSSSAGSSSVASVLGPSVASAVSGIPPAVWFAAGGLLLFKLL